VTGIVEGFRLSPQQAALWHDPASAARSVACVAVIGGDVDEDRLRRAVGDVVARHGILRTRFRRLPAMKLPLQVIEDEASFQWRREEMTGPARAAAAVLAGTPSAPADLDREPVLRATFAPIAPGEALLHLALPPLVADTATLGHLLAEVATAYAGGGPEPASVQYVEFSEWQHELAGDEHAQAAREHWKRQRELARRAGPPSALLLPGGGDRSSDARPDSFPIPLALDGEGAARLGVSVADLLLAAWIALLHRLGRGPTIAVDALLDGRRFEELAGALGPYSTPAPLAISVDGDEPFEALAARVASSVDEARERLEHAGAGSEAAAPTGAAYEFVEVPDVHPLGPIVDLHGRLAGAVQLSCRRGEGPPALEVRFDPAVADARMVERLPQALAALVESALREPQTAIDDLELVAPEEREAAPPRAPRVPGSRRRTTFTELFERQAARTPDASAARMGDRTLTYRELRAGANALARRLRELGVQPETPIALCARRSLEALVGIVGILESGGVYVPVDPGDPAGRKAYVVENAGVRLVVVGGADATSFPEGVERVSVRLDAGDAADPEHVAAPHHAAYVVYTSGSTGEPKGAVVEHASLADYLLWAGETLVGDLPMPAVTRATFDASLKQLLAPLLRGNEVWLVEDDLAADPAALYAELTQRDEPLALNCVPSLWQALLDLVEADPKPRLPATLRRLVLGGDAFSAELVRRTVAAVPGVEVWNAYGPTEATANASAGRVEGSEPVTIGRPMPGAALHVLDRRLRRVPPAFPGRLYVGGAVVARGYVGKPRETAARFVPDPFSGAAGARLYDTGDVVRLRPGGEIEFLGRDDLQVKIRGFRIELEGIEAVLRRVSDVSDAAVAARPLPDGDKQLVAYAVPEPGRAPRADAIRAELAKRLPEYMLPSRVSLVDSLPRTSSGKVDRRSLAELTPPAEKRRESSARPATAVEDAVGGLWQGLLGVPRVGVGDSFFELGGHSLLVIKLMSRIRDAFGVEVAPQTLFDAPTLREFAASVEQAIAERPGAAVPPLRAAPRGRPLPLSFEEEELWILERMEPRNPRYNVVAARRITGPLDVPALRQSIDAIVRRHEVLRSSFRIVSGWPRVDVAAHADVPLEVVDLRDLAPAEREEAAQRETARRAAEPFDLTTPPLLRATLFRLAAEEAALLVVLHHIVCDAWGKEVFFSELAGHYAAAVEGGPADVPDLPIQYADYAVWQRSALQGERLEQLVDYWRRRLDGLPELELPTDRPRPERPSYSGSKATRTAPPELTEALRTVSLEHGATLFMTSLAAFAVLLSRYSGQAEVAIGTPAAKRNRTELEHLVGYFVNSLVFRIDLGGDPTFAEVLTRVRTTSLEAYAHQDLPFGKLVEALNPARSRSKQPLFQVMFAYVAAPDPEVPMGGGAALRPAELESEAAAFDLNLTALEGADALDFYLTYDSGLFDAATAEGMLADLEALLISIAERPAARLSELAARVPEHALAR
jgi:amino acid adenylation domain-containing protein